MSGEVSVGLGRAKSAVCYYRGKKEEGLARTTETQENPKKRSKKHPKKGTREMGKVTGGESEINSLPQVSCVCFTGK